MKGIEKEAPEDYKYVNYTTKQIAGGGMFVDFDKWDLVEAAEADNLYKEWYPENNEEQEQEEND